MTITVGDALASFRARNGLGATGDPKAPFRVKLGPLVIPFPNPGKLHRHDLHHLTLGAPATVWGEVMVSAFELRTGSPTPFITLLCVGALVVGFVMSPRGVIVAWRRARGCKNLYDDEAPDDELLAMSLDALRSRMGLRS